MKDLGVGILPLVIWIACIFGWGANIYKLSNCDFDAPYKAETLRLIGVGVFPLGIVMGYIGIEDERKPKEVF